MTDTVTSTSTTDDSGPASTVGHQHVNWVFGWERAEGDPPFDFEERFADYYAWEATDGIFYDDFDPEHRVARSALAYGEIWEPTFNTLRRARHAVFSGPDVVAGDDLAASSLTFVAVIEPQGGGATGIRTTTSLVWRRTSAGWRIVREHNSSVVVPTAEVEPYLAASAAARS